VSPTIQVVDCRLPGPTGLLILGLTDHPWID
jgi:hypothetical protein